MALGYDGVEAAQSFARLEDVSVRPGHLGAGEALLGSLQNWPVDVHSDDMRYSLRQASGQRPSPQPTSSTDAACGGTRSASLLS